MSIAERDETIRSEARHRATQEALSGVADAVHERRTFQERGFPYDAHPTGWFQVAWSEELDSTPKPMRYFSQDLVAYRAASGMVTVLDAHCAHMGAHLGYGGQVEGDDIVCPFHSWRWNPDGENTEIPYSDGGCSRRTMRSWPVAETSGAVFVWHHPEGTAPTWSLPDPLIPASEDPAFHHPFPYAARAGVLSAPPQWVVENTVDLAHVKSVHRQRIPTNFEMEVVDDTSPHLLRLDLDAGFETPKGWVPIRARNFAYGVGMLTNHSEGLLPTSQLLSVTPIDHTQSQVRFSVFVQRQPDDERFDAPTGLSKAVAEAQLLEIFSQDRDFPIWENMIYLARAGFTKEEAAPFREFRRWAAQFYTS